MIYDYFKDQWNKRSSSRLQRSIASKFEKNDNVQGVDTKWDEELSIRKVPDEDILEIPYQSSSSAQRDYNLLCQGISRIQC